MDWHACREDVATAAGCADASAAAALHRELASAAESGWDFSSRWMADPDDLASMRTTRIVPADLNAFLCRMEADMHCFAQVDHLQYPCIHEWDLQILSGSRPLFPRSWGMQTRQTATIRHIWPGSRPSQPSCWTWPTPAGGTCCSMRSQVSSVSRHARHRSAPDAPLISAFWSQKSPAVQL